MTEMAHGAVPLPVGEAVFPRWWRTIDKSTFTAVFLLFAIGLLLGLASSPPLAVKNNLPEFHYVQRQAIFGTVALFVMMVISMMSPTMVRRLGIMGFAAAFLALALLPVLGTDFGKGAVRWYSLGFASVQPSEFLKPGFVIAIAWLMAASFDVNGPPGRSYSLILALLISALLAAQPDFGQASLVMFSWGVVYFVSGASMILLLGLAALAIFAGTFFYANSEHFARRIDGFLNPDLDPRTQLGYATNAIHEGGLFGVGVGEGSVKWSLPDAHTDFIIAVAAEEYGLVCVAAIVVLYSVIVVRSLVRLMGERDPFIRLAGAGLVCMFGVQAMINMGVAVRLLPAKGMTLPFVSYGGSSVIASGIAAGMLLALTRSRPQGRVSDILANHLARGRS